MTRATQAGVQEIMIAGGTIEFEEWPARPDAAAGPPLVFLHEGLGSRELWRGFPQAVWDATGRRSLVYSRHGYGRSSTVLAPRSVDYMHREAREVLPTLLAALGYERPVLIGHSDGASIALIHAGDGAQLSGLVALAPHVIVEDRSIEGIKAAREAYLTTDLPERMARYHRDSDATFWGWNRVWLSPEFRDWDITDLLPGVQCPVLMIQGEDDEYGTVRQLELIEERVAGPATKVLLPDCRHAPHLDQPGRTLAAVLDFL